MSHFSPSATPYKRQERLSLLLLVATALYVTSFIFFDLRETFHSDSALKSILAEIAANQGRLIPTHWIFANGDILTMTPYFFSRMLAQVMGISFIGNAIATWLGYACMLAGFWYCTRTVLAPVRLASLAALTLAASTLSSQNLEFIVVQGAYSVYAAAALVIFALVASYERSSWQRATVAFTLAVLLSSANPLRAAVTVFAPVALSLIATSIISSPKRTWQLWAFVRSPIILGTLGGGVVGWIFYKWVVLPDIANYDAAARVSLAPLPHFKHALTTIVPDWFTYFLIDQSKRPYTVPMKALQFLVWATTAGLLLAPAWVILTRSGGKRLQFLAWLCYALIAAGISPLLVTQGLYSGVSEIRYSTLGILVGFIVLAGAIGAELSASPGSVPRSWLARGALLLLSLTAFSTAAFWPSLTGSNDADLHGAGATDRQALVTLLENKQVGTAVGTYWNSHVFSVISNGQVMVYPAMQGDHLTPFLHHAPFFPFKGKAGARQAVIMTKEEFATDHGAAVERQFGQPSERLDNGLYVIYVYDATDVVGKVYGSGIRFDTPVERSTVRVDIGTGPALSCEEKKQCTIRLRVRNTGQVPLSSIGRYPMRIGLIGLNDKGQPIARDLARMEFLAPLKTGNTSTLETNIKDLPVSVASLTACLLQEEVTWLCDRTTDNGISATRP